MIKQWMERLKEQAASIRSGIKETAASKEGNSRAKKHYNREIVALTYLMTALMLGMLAYYVYFISMDSKNVVNNPYNKRQMLLAERVKRGNILGSKGEVLAATRTDKSGEEYREYPYDAMFCHVVGRFSNTRTGIEQMQNINLLTSNENPLVSIYRELKGEKNPGNQVLTTLDVNLQKTAYEALGNHKGAVVALEPSTGKVLAMVSKPDYNPNTVSKNWDQLTADEDNSPLLNRATQGLYPPGSTFKILTALEYLRENKSYEKYSYDCKGKDIFQGVNIRCYGGKTHGSEDLVKSFAKSCNTSFANIGMSLKINSYQALCSKFLFNRPLPTELAHSQSSFVLTGKSDRSEIPQTAIGQGDTQITPLHNAMITAAIANGGVMMKPYVVDALLTSQGETVKQAVPEEYGSILTSKETRIMKEMMRSVVTEGTASALNGLAFLAAGKTGSAEFDSSGDSHAWFVGFAPYDDPQIVVSIIVEGAGSGSEYAVPIASKMFESYLN